MPARNQHPGVPPHDEIKEWVEYYWCLGFTDKKIAHFLKFHYDTARYNVSERSVRRLRNLPDWQLLSTRKQQHSIESIATAVQEIRQRFPTMGARTMVTTLRQDYGIRVPERVVGAYLKYVEPEAVAGRKGRRFIRKLFYSAGVNDVWAFDQHDKWKRFGLYFHVGLDPYPGRCLWLRIWWTNRNPRLITSYYLHAAREQGGVALVTQSDPGTENYGIANCHTLLRQLLDPSLQGKIQHRWMRNKSNIKPEILWSILRRMWSPGFENVLDYGLLNGWYDPDNVLEKLVFLWLAVPWLQAELDLWVRRFNSSPRRADKHKLTPQGVPDLIAAHPEEFMARDYKVIVPPEFFNAAEEEWANPEDPVFQLTPPIFDSLASDMFFQRLGRTRADVHAGSFWNCYRELLAALRSRADLPDLSQAPQSQHRLDQAAALGEDVIPLLPDLQPLRHGEEVPVASGVCYIGGLDNAPALPESLMQVRPTQEPGANEDGRGSDSEDSESDIGLGPVAPKRVYARFSPPP